MEIRKAQREDLDSILPVYHRARWFMNSTGNPHQWGDGYPHREDVIEDIKNENLYLLEQDGQVQGVFALIFGEEPTYNRIEHGTWLNEAPYATIHRLAAATSGSGVAAECFAWCQGQCENLRIDTHEDNKVMQHVIQKGGFQRCGIIYVRDGSPRIAYQRCRFQEER